MTLDSIFGTLRTTGLRQLSFLLVAREKISARLASDRTPFEGLRRRFYLDLWTRTASEVGATIEELGDEYLRITRAGRSTFVKRGFVMLDSRLALEIAGHKPLALRLLLEAGAPTIRYLEFDLGGLRDAAHFLQELGAPAVVKPAVGGSAGAGITTGVTNSGELRRAALKAAAQSQRLLIEEQIAGDSWRLLYLDGEFIDAVLRQSCHVIGDGRSSIEQLVQLENRSRLEADPITSLHPLTVDLEMRSFLAENGRSLRDVPAHGVAVEVKRVVNQNARRENHSLRDRVHPETIELGARLANSLGIRLAGVDLLTTDASKQLAATGGVINEVNTTPGLHHHYLVSDPDQGVPVARLLLERLLEPTGG